MLSRSLLALAALALAYQGGVGGPVVNAAQSRSIQALDSVNLQLAGRGESVRVAMLEYLVKPGSAQYGATVYAKAVGNKQLGFHFAPELLKYATDLPGVVTYAVDGVDGAANGGLTGAQTRAAIQRAMTTWGSQDCSRVPMYEVDLPGLDLGYVQHLLGMGGVPGWGADLTHGGWLPKAFFDLIAENGGTYIIAATFTFIWIDDDGNPVDTDGDRKFDVAFREIYYNDAFTWTNEVVDYTSPYIDVETIALHEAGHGLSQAHFGMVFNDGYGTKTPGFQPNHIHFAPRAVMNAIYWDTQRSLLGSDVGGHCSIWGTWNR